jgi:SOS-response transcriptional repressor LexA
MRHLIEYKNIALVTIRRPRNDKVANFFVSNELTDKCFISSLDNCLVLPLRVLPKNGSLGFSHDAAPNIAAPFLGQLARALSIPQTGEHGVPVGLTPEDIFHFAYAVFHSPCYRDRYAEFLKVDFPRLPITRNLELFRALARLGGELTALHLLVSPRLSQPITAFIGIQNPAVEKISWSGDTVWVDKAQSTGFGGVREDVWNFHIGGYQVCEKWLKDRGPKKGKPGRTLSTDDISHYQKIVVAISETIRLMKEIDEVIEAHGGWPGAFETSAPAVESSKAVPAAAMQSAASTLLPFRPRTVEPSEPDRYVTCVPIFELAAAAGGFGEAQHVDEDSIEWVALDTRRKLRRGMFVARVVGRSMEPTIPDGSYCLFSSPVEGTREGKTVLVQLRDARDPETGQRYTVKRYESVKRAEADLWQHESITLKPINPEFEPIHLTGETDNEYQVIAEFLEVLREPAGEDAAGGHAPTFPVSRFESRPSAAAVKPVEESELDEDAADVRRVDVGELDRDEVICLIRQVFGDGVPRSRDAAIRELARALGYSRTGSRVSKVLDNALVTAVRRGVLANVGGDLRPEARRIDEYDRDFLKSQFLASLDGRAWKDRADSIRDFARWMGFRRTGAVIDETTRSLIKGLLRAGRLEADGQSIRRSG